MDICYQALKTRQRNERSEYPVNLNLRVHRALSWLDRSEQAENDLDAQFIFLWIAFNAAYANEFEDEYRLSEQKTFLSFIRKLCDLDDNNYLSDLVWKEFAGSIRVLLGNKFVFKPFWQFQKNKLTALDPAEEELRWQAKFKTANARAHKALGNKDTVGVLTVIFSRLYTLRNQTLHGGATWGSKVNREQMRDAVNFLQKFIPRIIEVMMNNADELWGEPCFPVVE